MLILCCLLGVGVFMFSGSDGRVPVMSWVTVPVAMAGCFLIGLHLNWDFTNAENQRVIHLSRNSYGTVRVEEIVDTETGEAQ